MNRYHKAIYCGNGNCFDLVCVIDYQAGDKVKDALVKVLHEGSWAVLIVDVDSFCVTNKLDLSCQPTKTIE